MKPEWCPQDVWEATENACKDVGIGNAVAWPEDVARAILAERERCAGSVEVLRESLLEGLMTDGDLTAEDRVAMNHQLEALQIALDCIRGTP
jgi:hypothetical protein